MAQGIRYTDEMVAITRVIQVAVPRSTPIGLIDININIHQEVEKVVLKIFFKSNFTCNVDKAQ